MGYELLSTDFNDFIASCREIDVSSSEHDLKRVKIDTPKGNICYNEEMLRQGLFIQESRYYMDDDVHILGKGDSSLLEIQLNLSHKGIFYKDKSNNEHIAPPKSGNIAFLVEEENQATILFQKDVSYNTFDIHLPVTLLDRYSGESRLMDSFLAQIHKGVSSMLTQQAIGLGGTIYNVLQDIKNCTYEGLTRRIYLESKSYELIALLYEGAENNKVDCGITAIDQEKIHWAASMIRENLESPLTIMELARAVGINQTKLKTGFKRLMGQTVFGYLQEIRMHKAKRYLLDTELSIQEIGMLLGYQNTSNFSIAFKNTYGYSPVKLREKHSR